MDDQQEIKKGMVIKADAPEKWDIAVAEVIGNTIYWHYQKGKLKTPVVPWSRKEFVSKFMAEK